MLRHGLLQIWKISEIVREQFRETIGQVWEGPKNSGKTSDKKNAKFLSRVCYSVDQFIRMDAFVPGFITEIEHDMIQHNFVILFEVGALLHIDEVSTTFRSSLKIRVIFQKTGIPDLLRSTPDCYRKGET